MKKITKKTITSAALTLALAASSFQSVMAHSGRMQTNAARDTSPKLRWAIVRVSVSTHGDIEGMRITYQSGDRPFDRTALQAVSKTTFASITGRAKASTFDYALTLDGRGKRTAHIMAALPGDAQVSRPTTVAVQGNNPWTTGEVVACRV